MSLFPMGINSSICEQTFSWFRSYAKIFNELREMRHKFTVLFFCKQHNHCLANGEATYLNAPATVNKLVQAQKKSKAYACSTKKVKKRASAKRAMKVKKHAFAKRVRKVIKRVFAMRAMRK